jgi:hypothetical protein
MTNDIHNNAPGDNVKTLRGILIMIVGAVLLLYTLGLIEVGLSFVLVVLAVASIVYGFYISGLYGLLQDYLHRSRQKSS